eukprot:TRINITY_DN5655_c0_g3_i1.p1 TRINITY_DN5655_c0_g3~~TRINITY_DN5655_c0_g3_i1.p1  ORF type:complete len:332 (+),score=91.15 TRINITY_DN5655_c0_g3_i1:91-1086(+)
MDSLRSVKQLRARELEKRFRSNQEVINFAQGVLLWNHPFLFFGLLLTFTFYYVSLFYSESTILSNLTYTVMLLFVGRLIHNVMLPNQKQSLLVALNDYHHKNAVKYVEPYTIPELAQLFVELEDLPAQVLGQLDSVKSKSNTFHTAILVLIFYGLSFAFDLFSGQVFFYIVGVVALCTPRIYRSKYHLAIYQLLIDLVLLADSLIPRASSVKTDGSAKTFTQIKEAYVDNMRNFSKQVQDTYQQTVQQVSTLKENLPNVLEQVQQQAKDVAKDVAQQVQQQVQEQVTVIAQQAKEELSAQLANPENQKVLVDALLNAQQPSAPPAAAAADE